MKKIEMLTGDAMNLVGISRTASDFEYGPDEYLLDYTRTSSMPMNSSKLCRRARKNPDNLEWIATEGYWNPGTIRHLDNAFKAYYCKLLEAEHTAIKKLNKIAAIPEVRKIIDE